MVSATMFAQGLSTVSQGAEESSLSSKTRQAPSYLVNSSIFHCRIPMCALKMHIYSSKLSNIKPKYEFQH
jgi:hypothetical protein